MTPNPERTDVPAGPVTSIEEVEARWTGVPYMRLRQATFLRDFLREHQLTELLELGFFQGKSTAFFAAMLEEMGEGHITSCDLANAAMREPSIHDLIEDLGLEHRVTAHFATRSFTWDLCKMLERPTPPQFDFCYIDGAHTWDGTGFAFLLVDLLLKPGGWVVFDDLDWTIAASEERSGPKKNWASYDDDEKGAPQVRKAFELLVPSRGYTDIHEEKSFRWGIARKPLA